MMVLTWVLTFFAQKIAGSVDELSKVVHEVVVSRRESAIQG